MEYQEYIEGMKKLYDMFLCFVDDEESVEYNFEKII